MMGMAGEEGKKQYWRKSRKNSASASPSSSGPRLSPITSLDDGCLMHIFSFLSPIPDRYNTALVCHRWRFLACHPRLWLRVDRAVKDLSEPGVFPNVETAVSSARKTELGCCLLHKSGRLTIDGCVLQCESNPLDYLSCPIKKKGSNGVSVSETRIEGGAKAVLTNGGLALQRVRVIYARACVYFWFDVDHQ
ncbi:F-box protein SKIP5 [Linum perenne]